MRTTFTFILLAISMCMLIAQSAQRVAKTPALNHDWRPGFVSITELTVAPGLGRTDDGYSKFYYGFTSVAGYQFTRNIKVGGGVGLHIHEDGTLFPLYMDIRYSLSAQKLVPFFSGAGGIMLYLKELGQTRVFINPAVGLHYVAANKMAINLSTGLMVTTGGPAERKSFLNLKLGLEFKGK